MIAAAQPSFTSPAEMLALDPPRPAENDALFQRRLTMNSRRKIHTRPTNHQERPGALTEKVYGWHQMPFL